ncbi:hypothetical protein [Maritimibacter sp. HL-12]|uniref:hypothetical protein n=1 Tax=Maritimibacter sp. HL-12 TaxID=1162418 RepID=UPI000A0F21B7|nr:hypothetical protein [Maritimibacter sp. HL-12]SMH29516.1 hypothetical protein SAMN05661107_0096 [Maritimibacter sp. HL-12]
MLSAAAVIYAGLAALVVLFQLALAAGAPWGHLAMGGRYPGRFPPSMRAAAVVQAAVIVALSLIILGGAGLARPAPPGWLVWAVVAVSALSAAMNLATKSIPERRLWAPVALLMLVCALRVALG